MPRKKGSKLTEEHKRKIRESKTGKVLESALENLQKAIQSNIGRKLSPSHIDNLIKSHNTENFIRSAKKRMNGNKYFLGHKLSESHKNSIRISVLNRMKNSTQNISKSETYFLNLLSQIYNVKIERQYPILFENIGFAFDGKYENILFEIDGEYWHRGLYQKRKDELKTFTALDNGFNLVRVNINSVKEVEETIRTCGIELDKIFEHAHKTPDYTIRAGRHKS